MDRQILEAHEAATSALKACRETQGLTVERVENTLDALAEVILEAVHNALSYLDRVGYTVYHTVSTLVALA